MSKEIISLLIRGGRIIDPSQGIDQIGDLLVSEGKIVQAGGTVIAEPFTLCHSEQSEESRRHRD